MIRCDVSYCRAEGDHPLSKYINLCGMHWFLIMNGIPLLGEMEKQKLEALETERRENDKK